MFDRAVTAMSPAQKIDVLYLNHVSQISGAETSLVSLLTHLNTAHYRPIVGLPEPGPLAEQLQRLDVEIAFLPHPRLRRTNNPLALLGQHRALRNGSRLITEYVEDNDIDLVHANSLSSAIAAARGLQGRTPLLWHVRDLRLPALPTRWLVHQVSAIIAISQAVASRLVELTPEALKKTRVIYNGVDTGAFTPRPSGTRVRQELGLPEDALLVGGVGQLVPWKDWPQFLRVGADVIARVDNVHLLIIGSDLFHDYPHYHAELSTLAEDLAIGTRTHFLGFRSDIADVMSALDVFVHCTDEEPLGRAIMEAMALERPIVAVRSGGPAELIIDGESGLLAPPGDLYALADHVVQLLENRELAQRLGKAARLRVESAFRPEQTAHLVEQVYEDLLWQEATE
ncbi:MAG: glycosyltransferase family 4 protein [Candidatus Zipacnadales bacterium]